MRLLNELLDADYPGGTRKLLAENRQSITPDFVESLACSPIRWKPTVRPTWLRSCGRSAPRRS